jgi:SAM-dependent methyltransferase
MTDTAFVRYLAAKKTVDDRALNATVWATLARALPTDRPVRVLEVGAGIGTMIERAIDHGLFAQAHYTAVDAQPANIAAARQRLGVRPSKWHITLHTADLFDFLQDHATEQWDVLIAHAVLDLLDLPSALPALLGALRPGGLSYFTLNFDGNTIFQPEFDPAFDQQIETLYHRTMDERQTQGRPSGDSRTGRHLLPALRQAGVTLLAAGSSDWVVFPGPHGYVGDEAYFLRFIVETVGRALGCHPGLDPARLAHWLTTRRAQIERGELIYIAHQLDVLGMKNGG